MTLRISENPETHRSREVGGLWALATRGYTGYATANAKVITKTPSYFIVELATTSTTQKREI